MITKPGFISNPYSRTRGDSISAEQSRPTLGLATPESLKYTP